MHSINRFTPRLNNCMLFFILFLFIVSGVRAQVIPVETNQNAMVFQVDSKKDLKMVYLGEKLSRPSEYTQISDQYKQATDYTDVYNSAYFPETHSSLDSNSTFSGEFLMTIGFNPQVNLSRKSVVLVIHEIK